MSKPPAKRRNNEKRKEKSRVAARCRRNKEQHIFSDLTAALPVRKEDVEQLDKASVIRLAISYLRVRDVVSMLPDVRAAAVKAEAATAPPDAAGLPEDVSYLQALDGFVLVISQLGDVVYCSENVADHLGISQLEIMGQSIFELSHPCDHDELRDVLRPRARPAASAAPSAFLLRLKCTLTGKGRSVHIKSASYKVIQFTGHVIMPSDESALRRAAARAQGDSDADADADDKMAADKMAAGERAEEGERAPRVGSLVAVGRPIPHPTNIETPLGGQTFLTKHSLDMKFTYFDEVLQQGLGFEAGELVGQSLYEHQHAADSAALAHHFKSLFSKGQCETGRYRFLGKSGGYAWVQTQATLITDKQQRPVSVVCVNYLISGIECIDEVFSANQMRYADLKTAPLSAPTPPLEPVVEIKPKTALPPLAPRPVTAQIVPRLVRAPKASALSILGNGDIVEEIVTVPPPPIEEARPRPATEHIFAPRTKDMNKGYLTFPKDNPGHTMLKEEPEDLTHLAPTPGDACIPLEDSPFDMFEEFILSDNYCSLLGDDLANGSPVDSLAADSLLLSSPEPLESESSCEQSSLLTELSLDALDGRSEGELDGRAPYIPMSERDELPLLAPAVMWGALPDSVSLARPSPPEPSVSPPAAPALQRLLAAPPHTGPPPQDIITNIYADQGLIPGGGVTTWDTGVKRGRTECETSTTPKRTKRCASPSALAPTAPPSSSVLMNLLDLPGRPVHLPINMTHSFLPPNYQYILPNPPQTQPMIQKHTTLPQLIEPISPLSLNIGSPMYGSPMSTSPAIGSGTPVSPYPTPPGSSALSPLLYSRVFGKLSPGPNAPGTHSPGGVLQSGRDPFLSTKMLSPRMLSPSMLSPRVLSPRMLSPNVCNYRNEGGGDVSMLDMGKLSGADGDPSWMDADVLQDPADLLATFDDVRLM